MRWRVSLGDEAFRRDPDLGFGIFEPVFEVRDGAGRSLPWSPRGGGTSDGESDGEAEVRELPEAGGSRLWRHTWSPTPTGPKGSTKGRGRPTTARGPSGSLSDGSATGAAVLVGPVTRFWQDEEQGEGDY